MLHLIYSKDNNNIYIIYYLLFLNVCRVNNEPVQLLLNKLKGVDDTYRMKYLCEFLYEH